MKTIKHICMLGVVAFLMYPHGGMATIISYDYELDLSGDQIIGDSWRYGVALDPGTTFQDGDSINVNVTFSGNQELVWTDSGSDFEYAILTFWTDPIVQLEILSDAVFRWDDPSGGNLFDEVSGTSSYSGGGFGASSMMSNDRNVTDDVFSITGFSFEINNLRDRANVPGDSGLPATFDFLSMSLNGGEFSIQDRVAIIEPPSLIVFSLALALLVVSRKWGNGLQKNSNN